LVLCKSCLERLFIAGRKRSRTPLPLYVALALSNVTLLYALFYAAGSLLLRLPSSFHDGSMLTPDARQPNEPRSELRAVEPEP
jgi:hypothetical protein